MGKGGTLLCESRNCSKIRNIARTRVCTCRPQACRSRASHASSMVLTGFHVGGAIAKMGHYEVNREVCLVPGFMQLQWYLTNHAEIPELYLLLMALLLGQRVGKLPAEMQVRAVSNWVISDTY